jgi:penicillin amidase
VFEESVGGTVYQVLLFRLIKNIVQPHLGQTLTAKYLGIGDHPLLLPVNELLGHSTEAVIRIFQNSDSKWVPSGKSALSLIEKSLVESCLWLEENMGYESSGWNWGNLHQAEFQHSLSVKKPLNQVFNKGPYPIGGDTDTVHQSIMVSIQPLYYGCRKLGCFSCSFTAGTKRSVGKSAL